MLPCIVLLQAEVPLPLVLLVDTLTVLYTQITATDWLQMHEVKNNGAGGHGLTLSKFSWDPMLYSSYHWHYQSDLDHREIVSSLWLRVPI